MEKYRSIVPGPRSLQDGDPMHWGNYANELHTEALIWGAAWMITSMRSPKRR